MLNSSVIMGTWSFRRYETWKQQRSACDYILLVALNDFYIQVMGMT